MILALRTKVSIGISLLLIVISYSCLAQTKLPTLHNVKAGSHDYSPGHGLNLDKLSSEEYTYTVDFVLPQEAWFDPMPNGPIQRDGNDWNKLAGVSFLGLFSPSTWPKNHCSALVGWRPGLANTFQICLYINDCDGGFTASQPISVKADVRTKLRVIVSADVTTMEFIYPNQPYGLTQLPSSIIQSRKVNVGPWFGGNRAAPMAHGLRVDMAVESNSANPN